LKRTKKNKRAEKELENSMDDQYFTQDSFGNLSSSGSSDEGTVDSTAEIDEDQVDDEIIEKQVKKKKYIEKEINWSFANMRESFREYKIQKKDRGPFSAMELYRKNFVGSKEIEIEIDTAPTSPNFDFNIETQINDLSS
jgi:hypothetical protein